MNHPCKATCRQGANAPYSVGGSALHRVPLSSAPWVLVGSAHFSPSQDWQMTASL